MLSRASQSEFLSPEDLAVCQRVFDRMCADCRWDHDSSDAEALATVIISVFQRGVFNEADLLEDMQGRRNDFERRTG
jgi:hypothetical protein